MSLTVLHMSVTVLHMSLTVVCMSLIVLHMPLTVFSTSAIGAKVEARRQRAGSGPEGEVERRVCFLWRAVVGLERGARMITWEVSFSLFFLIVSKEKKGKDAAAANEKYLQNVVNNKYLGNNEHQALRFLRNQ